MQAWVTLYLVLNLLAGCASTYGKAEPAPWMGSINELKGDTDLNQLDGKEIAQLLSPAFSDEVFAPV